MFSGKAAFIAATRRNEAVPKFFFYAVFIFYKDVETGRYTPEVGRATNARPSPIEESNVTKTAEKKALFLRYRKWIFSSQ